MGATTTSPTSTDSQKSESYSQVYGPYEPEISLHIDKLTLVVNLPSQVLRACSNTFGATPRNHRSSHRLA